MLSLTIGTSNESRGGPLFDILTADTAPGSCAKCHSVDRPADGSAAVNWKASAGGEDGFTTYSHAAHLSRAGVQTCVSCHALSREGDFLAAYEHSDPGDFTPPTKSRL